ncbi:hypothetical protein HDU96_001125 [Phlyctochytrium bullatum]|nr:hypothetical protein HDU96_001125 [Phlyctochytrium bullatum]
MDLLVLCLGDPPDRAFSLPIDNPTTTTAAQLQHTVGQQVGGCPPTSLVLFALKPGPSHRLPLDDPRLAHPHRLRASRSPQDRAKFAAITPDTVVADFPVVRIRTEDPNAVLAEVYGTASHPFHPRNADTDVLLLVLRGAPTTQVDTPQPPSSTAATATASSSSAASTDGSRPLSDVSMGATTNADASDASSGRPRPVAPPRWSMSSAGNSGSLGRPLPRPFGNVNNAAQVAQLARLDEKQALAMEGAGVPRAGAGIGQYVGDEGEKKGKEGALKPSKFSAGPAMPRKGEKGSDKAPPPAYDPVMEEERFPQLRVLAEKSAGQTGANAEEMLNMLKQISWQTSTEATAVIPSGNLWQHNVEHSSFFANPDLPSSSISVDPSNAGSGSFAASSTNLNPTPQSPILIPVVQPAFVPSQQHPGMLPPGAYPPALEPSPAAVAAYFGSPRLTEEQKEQRRRKKRRMIVIAVVVVCGVVLLVVGAVVVGVVLSSKLGNGTNDGGGSTTTTTAAAAATTTATSARTTPASATSVSDVPTSSSSTTSAATTSTSSTTATVDSTTASATDAFGITEIISAIATSTALSAAGGFSV